ncbi:hypothetical protein HanIR_Chr14g0692181 [Helianthus annuus]|nr:hypothetical protein HanIR_Chr14g0692181 [Helianthus annuus]
MEDDEETHINLSDPDLHLKIRNDLIHGSPSRCRFDEVSSSSQRLCPKTGLPFIIPDVSEELKPTMDWYSQASMIVI